MPRGLILGIETSCDETAAAVVERGARVLSSVVASQIATHARYGGVVPELASREHLRAIVPVVRAALTEAGLSLSDLDAIAVTSGPGLAGALLVGITYAKALAFANNLPLIAVNHLEGHIHAVLLQERETERESAARAQTEGAPGLDFETRDGTNLNPSPALALVVSGGHTHLFLVRPADGIWSYTLIGRTVDDAAGEAFDKVAKLLGLGYPGGPWIDALAKFGNPQAVPFAFAQIKTKAHLGGKPARTKAEKTAPIARLDPHFLFSFSGIKTAVLRYVELHGLRAESKARVSRVLANFNPPQTREESLALCPQPTLDLIASFQHAVIGDLMKKTFAAAESLSAAPKSLSAAPKSHSAASESLSAAPKSHSAASESLSAASESLSAAPKSHSAASESLSAARILVTGGVAANSELRARFTAEAAHRGLEIAFPTLALSTDNAAMIAAAAWPRLLAKDFAPPDLSADPSLALR